MILFCIILVKTCLIVSLDTYVFQETKLITDKTYKKVQENNACLVEIEEILRKDRRFLVLEAASAERTRLLMGYLEELARRGPPPPPTASEPSRRPTTK